MTPQFLDESLEVERGFVLSFVECGEIVCIFGKISPKGVIDKIRYRTGCLD